MSTPAALRDAAEKAFSTATKRSTPELESLDPSERLEFSRPPATGIKRLDDRSDSQLREAAIDHPDAVERENAVWEYADRHRAEAVGLLKEVAKVDSDPSIRWTTLWAIQKFGDAHAADVIGRSLTDEHPEVRDWAHLLLREITGHFREPVARREAKFDLSNPFDQTLPLQIAGYARVLVAGRGWFQATLSPKWFEAILGRVMACTNVSTFDTDLVVEKRLAGYHSDGSDHFEIYKFRGFSFHPAQHVKQHVYECHSTHTFYPSGKVEDKSVEPLSDVGIVLNRVAESVTKPAEMPVNFISSDPTRQDDAARRGALSHLVESVRGRYMGAAYVNVGRVAENQMRIGPGEVQLSSLHHPVAGPLTNTYLFGTFKGKLSDLDGDGYLDINTEPCHGTFDGRLDYNLDGLPDPDPFDPCYLA